jgi:hypothetical protein
MGIPIQLARCSNPEVGRLKVVGLPPLAKLIIEETFESRDDCFRTELRASCEVRWRRQTLIGRGFCAFRFRLRTQMTAQSQAGSASLEYSTYKPCDVPAVRELPRALLDDRRVSDLAVIATCSQLSYCVGRSASHRRVAHQQACEAESSIFMRRLVFSSPWRPFSTLSTATSDFGSHLPEGLLGRIK